MRQRLAPVAYPLGALLVALGAWHLATAGGFVPSFLLPAPARVASALAQGIADGSLPRHLAATLAATGLGWLAGCLAALFLAALIAEFRTAAHLLLWPVTALQSIPKVSVAPLVFLWAGFGISGKVVLVALICFFPVFANALTGLAATDPALLDLLRAHGASRTQRFVWAKLPQAAPQIFAGLEVATTFALIGCVVMEFVGATSGIGFLIQDASNQFALATVFAAILSVGLTGVLLNLCVRGAGRWVVFWNRAPVAARSEAG
jgi:NitT/TauT family transport system permease protein